ncbi:MAG: flavodoxin domain-containing protein [Acidimicrobiia bacterium]
MEALVVYESIFGNTHQIADQIANGLRPTMDVTLTAVGNLTAEMLAAADLVVVGGPTHAHSMSRASTRADGIRRAELPDSELRVDPDAEDPGLREWFETEPEGHGIRAAAFDTRVDMNPAISGRASKGIAKRLGHHGFTMVTEPESFLVSRDDRLVVGEAARARTWATTLAQFVTV